MRERNATDFSNCLSHAATRCNTLPHAATYLVFARHTVQQRSLQLLDQQKSSEAKMLSDVSLRLSDAEQYTHTLER